MKNIKQRLRNGETLTGCWLNLGSSITAEIVGLAGFDWVLIDLEHGPGSEKDLLHQLQALEHTPVAPIVRVESFERQRIHRVLDLGAEGVMVPRVSDTQEAQRVVSAIRYAPHGGRGVARMVRAAAFGQDFTECYSNATETLLGIIQIETIESLNHLDAIASLDGVDVLFIGPADLSMELGCFGQLTHPSFKDAVKATIDAAERAGKATGILLPGPDEATAYSEMGMRLIACGSDAGFIVEGARSMSTRLRAALTKG
jgi:4-hydroxy-2-oxoheptanedioate aldolase